MRHLTYASRQRGEPRHSLAVVRGRTLDSSHDAEPLVLTSGNEGKVEVMSSTNPQALLELCERVKHLGYAARKRVRIYGADFDVVSDPFPDGEGVSMHVISGDRAELRVLRFPVAILLSGKSRRKDAA
jgi:hypothetical protein